MSYRYPTPRSPHPSQADTGRAMDYGVGIRSHTDRVRAELRKLGVSPFAMLRPEILYLPKRINDDETIKGIVYGHDASGSVLLVATDQRILRLSRQPVYIDEEEIDFEMVSGISYYSGIISSVILHTRTRDFRVHTFNHQSALTFIGYIEERCLETTLGPSALWRTI